MADTGQIGETLKLYTKHGWSLRRVLLSPEARNKLGDEITTLFAGADVRGSDIDAAWFARSSRPGDDTWELRSLGAEQFALCEVFSEDDDDDAREEAMLEMEARLRERAR